MKDNSRKGFTLLEVLIALSLTAVILAIIFAALHLAYRAQKRSMAVREMDQRARAVQDRLSWLLRGAYPFSKPKDKDFLDKDKIYVFYGDSDNVSFVTTSTDTYSGGPEDLPGLKWVRIFSQEGKLLIEERVFFMDKGGADYVLDPDLFSIKFEYLDVDTEHNSSEWVSNWDPEEKKGMPGAVRADIILKNGKEKREINFTTPLFAASIPSKKTE